MNEKEFRANVQSALAVRGLVTEVDGEFWSGYTEGLSRNFHGVDEDNLDEHERYMAFCKKKDRMIRFAGIGYKAGFEGKPFLEAMAVLHKSFAASAAGAKKSDVKKTTSAANARKSRPNAQGQKRRREPSTVAK